MATKQGQQIYFYDSDAGKYKPVRSGNQTTSDSMAVTLATDETLLTSLDSIGTSIWDLNESNDDNFVLIQDELSSIGTSINAIRYNTEFDFRSRCAAGQTDDVFYFTKWGQNEDIDSAAEEGMWPWGTYDPASSFQTTDETYTITYNNATDGDGTSGATSLLVSYLDSNYEYAQGVHTLGNTGSDVTSFSGYGINRAVVLSNGGDRMNNNDIDFFENGTSTQQAQIPAGDSVTQQVIYHTGIDRTICWNGYEISCLKLSGSNPTVTFRVYSYSRVTDTVYQIFKVRLDAAVENNLTHAFVSPTTFGGREIIYMTAETDTDNTVASGRMEFKDISNTGITAPY